MGDVIELQFCPCCLVVDVVAGMNAEELETVLKAVAERVREIGLEVDESGA